MKEKLKNSPFLQKWFYTQSPLVITRPALRETAACLGLMLCGFVLACGSLSGTPAPFALSLLATAGGGLRGLSCLIGAAAGYLTMQPFTQGLQLTSSGILIYVCAYIFGSLWVTRQRWFRCLVAGTMTGAVGLIFLLSQELTAQVVTGYVQTVLLTALMPLAYDRMFREKKRCAGSLLALATFLVGAAAIPLPWGMCLGTVLGVALTGTAARRADLLTAAAIGAGCGLGLDAALLTGGFWTMVLCCGGLLGAAVRKQFWGLRIVTFGTGMAAVVLFTGSDSPAVWATLGAGLVLSLLLPAGLIAGREESAIEQSSDLVEHRLSRGEGALSRLYDAVGLDPETRENQEKSHIFDKAAAKVCRRCTRYGQCWDKGAQDTYRSLVAMLPAILERGEVRREDFPEAFALECRHLEGLVVAVNQELDSIACRSQCRSRTEENRIIVSRTLLHLSRMLGRNARQLRSAQGVPEEAYRVRLGVAAKGRHGARLSGDRGLSFHTEDGNYYVILCDGAGTGEPAAQESLLAVEALADLITAGMPPEDAMELLDGVYILRDAGSFATMDVLEVSLLTGQGTLYKWGAAPSYLRSGTVVRKMGSAAPPPGLGVGSTYGAEVLRLNLWGGDLLVLVSDGVICDGTEELIRSFEGENVKALANALVDRAAESSGEDDMTAAVVRIEEC